MNFISAAVRLHLGTIFLATRESFALEAFSTFGAEEGVAKKAPYLTGRHSGFHPEPPGFICLGNDTGTECVNPHDSKQCPTGASKRAAITFTFDQYIPWTFNETWYKVVKAGADLNNADLVLLLPADEAPETDRKRKCNMLSVLFGSCHPTGNRVSIPESELAIIEKYFRIVRTPWVVPPGLSDGVPREGGCCGAREFMKLHAFALEEYDAVVNLDTDMSVIGSIKGLFDCAASGHFLTARGSMSGVNGGMFAAKPSKSILYDILIDLSHSSANDQTGWNNRGLAPDASYGQGGLQGFLYYYFYQKGSPYIKSGQVDPCLWTGAVFCDKKQACKESPLRHKIKCGDGRDEMLFSIKPF